jgi:hypothetical protein
MLRRGLEFAGNVNSDFSPWPRWPFDWFQGRWLRFDRFTGDDARLTVTHVRFDVFINGWPPHGFPTSLFHSHDARVALVSQLQYLTLQRCGDHRTFTASQATVGEHRQLLAHCVVLIDIGCQASAVGPALNHQASDLRSMSRRPQML